MSNELTASGSLTFNATEEVLSINGLNISMTGGRLGRIRQSVVVSTGALIALGPVTGLTLGWFLLINRSATVTISILTGSAGTLMLSLLPGEFAMGRFGSGITAPYVYGSAAANYALDGVVYEN